MISVDFVIDIITLLLSAFAATFVCYRYVFPWIEKSKFVRSVDAWLAEKVEKRRGNKK